MYPMESGVLRSTCLDVRGLGLSAEVALPIQVFLEQMTAVLEKTPDTDMRDSTLLRVEQTPEIGGLHSISTAKNLQRWSPLSSWERGIAREKRFEAWMQFSPWNQIRDPGLSENLTVALPDTREWTLGTWRPKSGSYVVPSSSDALRLQKLCRLDSDSVHPVTPSVRPSILNWPVAPSTSPHPGWVLFLLGCPKHLPKAQRWIEIISSRFPKVERKILSLSQSPEVFQNDSWHDILRNTRVCFYLSRSPLDWCVPAFEAMFARIPTIFLDDCGAVSELLPKSKLSLARFLVETPEYSTLLSEADENFSVLHEAGVFHPTRLFEQITSLLIRRDRVPSREGELEGQGSGGWIPTATTTGTI